LQLVEGAWRPRCRIEHVRRVTRSAARRRYRFTARPGRHPRLRPRRM